MRACGLVLGVFAILAVIASACADGEKADTSLIPEDAGTPEGYAACNGTFFGNYLKPCSVTSDCGGVLRCDLSKKFGQTPRCHAQECGDVSECENAYKTLCNGGDFHFACDRSNLLVPTECRLVQGAPTP